MNAAVKVCQGVAKGTLLPPVLAKPVVVRPIDIEVIDYAAWTGKSRRDERSDRLDRERRRTRVLQPDIRAKNASAFEHAVGDFGAKPRVCVLESESQLLPPPASSRCSLAACRMRPPVTDSIYRPPDQARPLPEVITSTSGKPGKYCDPAEFEEVPSLAGATSLTRRATPSSGTETQISSAPSRNAISCSGGVDGENIASSLQAASDMASKKP